MAISGVNWRFRKAELLPCVHLGHPAGHLLLPSRRVLFEPTQEVGRLFLILLGQRRELLFQFEHGRRTHGSKIADTSWYSTTEKGGSSLHHQIMPRLPVLLLVRQRRQIEMEKVAQRFGVLLQGGARGFFERGPALPGMIRRMTDVA